MQLLLSDDDPEMRRMLAHRLRACGHFVTEAIDGTHLRLLVDELIVWREPESSLIDLVVSDIRMPGCSGLDVLAHLRACEREVPVILITAFGSDEVHVAAGRLGAFAVFDKPFDLDDLCTAIVNSPAR